MGCPAPEHHRAFIRYLTSGLWGIGCFGLSNADHPCRNAKPFCSYDSILRLFAQVFATMKLATADGQVFDQAHEGLEPTFRIFNTIGPISIRDDAIVETQRGR